MTSRERVLKALRHEQPDLIPLDLGGTESSGMTGVAYNRLREYLGLGQGETRIFDVYQQVVKIEDDVREILKPDTIPLLMEPVGWKPFHLPDGSPCQIPEKWNPEKCENGDLVVRDPNGIVVARMPESGYYFEPTHAPLARIKNGSELDTFTDEIESFDWPSFADESYEVLARRAKSLFEETDLAVVANLQLHLLSAGQQLRGYETFMMDLVMNKTFAHELLERLTEAYIRRCASYLASVGEYVQIVLVNDDLGTQTGPMLSLDCYREMIWPYQKRLFQFIKGTGDTYILLHSCGSVYPFIPLLIEAGVDALNPIQVSAKDMDTARLKDEFGRDLTFWGGGCDTQHVLRTGTRSQIDDEVRKRVKDLSPGGGFVFSQVHNIQPDVQPENVMTMLQAFEKYRRYGDI